MTEKLEKTVLQQAVPAVALTTYSVLGTDGYGKSRGSGRSIDFMWGFREVVKPVSGAQANGHTT